MISTSYVNGASGPEVRMRFVTRKADREMARLDPCHQLTLADAFQKPVAQRNCQLVTRLAKHRVFHFTAGALRVSFRMVAHDPCVVHAGTHEQYDEFAKTYNGRIPQHLIPIQESIVMARKHFAERNQGGNHNNIGDDQVSVAAIAGDDAQMLCQLLLEVVGKVAAHQNEHLATITSSLGERLQEHTDTSVRNLQQSHEQQQERLKSRMNTLVQRDTELAQHLDDLRRDLANCETRLAKAREEMASGLREQQLAMEVLKTDLARESELRSATLAGMAEQVFAAESRTADLHAELRCRWEHAWDEVARTVAAVSEHESALACRATHVETQVARLGEAIARIEASLRACEASQAALPAHQQHLEMRSALSRIRDWWRRLRQSFEHFTSWTTSAMPAAFTFRRSQSGK